MSIGDARDVAVSIYLEAVIPTIAWPFEGQGLHGHSQAYRGYVLHVRTGFQYHSHLISQVVFPFSCSTLVQICQARSQATVYLPRGGKSLETKSQFGSPGDPLPKSLTHRQFVECHHHRSLHNYAYPRDSTSRVVPAPTINGIYPKLSDSMTL